MSILQFDRANATAISAEALTALQAVATKHGLTVQSAGGTIGGVRLVLKVEFQVADKAAASANERQEFGIYCHHFGLKPAHYKARFTSRMTEYELFGFLPRRPKFPLKGRRISDGRVMLFPTDIADRIRGS